MLLEQLIGTEVIESTEAVDNTIQMFNGLDSGDVITGIIIPIIAAILAYALAERASQRKDGNRLVIELNWIKKEIENNKSVFQEYLSIVKSKEEIEDVLKYPFVPYENLLIEMIERIEKIYLEHEIFCDFLLHGEHGKSVAQMIHKYDLLERDVFEIREAYNDCIKIPESKEKEIEELEIKRVELKRKIEDTVGPESSIFDQLNNLYCFIELKKIGINIPIQEEENNDVVLCVKYIRDILEEYSKIESPTLDDAKDTFKKLLIYDSKVDVFKNVSTLEESEIEIRKIYVEQCNRIESCMISMYEKYVFIKHLECEIEKYSFKISTSKWQQFQDDFVLINDSEKYFAICDLYEHFIDERIEICELETVIDKCVNVIQMLSQLEKKIKRKCLIFN